MNEEFLHYVWQFRIYGPELELVSGEKISVLHPGEHNNDSGPDFFNARIRMGDTVWAGNVEVHINSSDWVRHRHQEDKAYDNVILHVVFRHDQPISRQDGTEIPTLILEDKLSRQAWKRYLQFMASRSWIPCENIFRDLDKTLVSSWLDCLLVERLERKAGQVEQLLQLSGNDWNQAFYRLLARNMGFKLNNEAFEQLAASLPYSYLQKHADDLFQLEAMIFGQAGLLENEFTDEYPQRLRKEYLFLKEKFTLTPMDSHLWRFMRLHPLNFPTLRLSQFAALIHKTQGLFSRILENENIRECFSLFEVEASEYWQTHYVFDKKTTERPKRLGSTAVGLLLINLVAPFLFVFGRAAGVPLFAERPMELLEKLEGELNTITRKWMLLGMDNSTAAQSQALIELKNNYCKNKKCLSCRIGIILLKNSQAEG